jgi:mono/diheme cytochrome c family protein
MKPSRGSVFKRFKFALLVAAGSIAALLALLGAAESEHGNVRPANPYSGNAEVAKEGASLFNQYCSHCHGPWAEQGERPRDLRRLRIRYGDDAISTFYSTVNNGRLDKGMPVWKGILPDQVLWKIYTFLETVQVEE